MPNFNFQIVFFCSDNTATRRAGGHTHTAVYLPGHHAYSWGRIDQDFILTGPGSTRRSARVALGANVYYQNNLGFGHTVFAGITNNTTLAAITTAGENWLATHDAGGTYPSNCRGAADSFITAFAPNAQHTINTLTQLFNAQR